MLLRYPSDFYAQTWYLGESFLDVAPRARLDWPVIASMTANPGHATYTAADMARLWLTDPHHLVWQWYLWTADKDSHGQRIYVGQNGSGLEIHRHLHLTERWRVPQ
jgi:hypothetical protein